MKVDHYIQLDLIEYECFSEEEEVSGVQPIKTCNSPQADEVGKEKSKFRGREDSGIGSDCSSSEDQEEVLNKLLQSEL